MAHAPLARGALVVSQPQMYQRSLEGAKR